MNATAAERLLSDGFAMLHVESHGNSRWSRHLRASLQRWRGDRTRALLLVACAVVLQLGWWLQAVPYAAGLLTLLAGAVLGQSIWQAHTAHASAQRQVGVRHTWLYLAQGVLIREHWQAQTNSVLRKSWPAHALHFKRTFTRGATGMHPAFHVWLQAPVPADWDGSDEACPLFLIHRTQGSDLLALDDASAALCRQLVLASGIACEDAVDLPARRRHYPQPPARPPHPHLHTHPPSKDQLH